MRLLVLVAAVAFAISPLANAQPPQLPAGARPKICLVLSGGGARGAAHVGVIKALEALRVPIDCIAGTSMGALVGGAYASGMTVPEMEAVLREITTDLLFREKPPRQDQTVRRKQDDRSLLFGFEVGLRDGELLFPKGVVSGVQLETVLRRLAKAPGFRRFDALPIPFRAVATDLVSGKAVVFADGELANVMRASMSVPAVVAPAEVDGMLLVDGGLTNNLPIDVARAMGADIVIAVNLGTPLMKREALTSVFGVTGQMINILTEQNVQASLAALRSTDILIEPALGDFSFADFDHLQKTVPIGVAAVAPVAPKLSALALSPEAYAALRVVQTGTTPEDRRPVAEVRFRPMARVNPAALVDDLETQPGRPLDQAALDRDMRRLYGGGDFEHVNYRILEEAGRRVLDVDAVEKSWGPNYLRFGLGLASDLQGENHFNIAASYRRTWINPLGGEWRTDLQLGHTSRLYTELYQPLETRRLVFVSPQLEIERRSADAFEDNQRIARYHLRHATGALDVGTSLTKYGEIRAGLLAGALAATLDTGPAQLRPPDDRIRIGAFRVRALLDQLDSANFPRFGVAAAGIVKHSTKALGAGDEYTRWEADAIGAYSIGPHTLHVAARAGGALGGNPLPVYDLFQWGGFLQQSGYPTGALIGERLAFGRVVYAYKLVHQQLLEGLYAGVSLEAGTMKRPLVAGSPTDLLKSAAVFLGADTPFGPFYLGYGAAADGNRSAYVFLGRP